LNENDTGLKKYKIKEFENYGTDQGIDVMTAGQTNGSARLVLFAPHFGKFLG